MKINNSFNLLPKITFIFIITVLVISTTSCSKSQKISAEVEAAPTPSQKVETVENVEKKPSKTTNSTLNQLPVTVKSAVLSDATKRIGKSVATLRIIESQQKNWSDACLGLAEPGKLCTQVIVSGWKVVVSDGKNELVYRTDGKGKKVKWEN